ncbi:hypothetical protein [uncultured Streptomyces sp.]|uniref:hypothetical protein n=1 Tax=uncultured Streptomyces sp. TaxID=174707 RepID=UPI002630F8F1|nr:hypothetical protein [uncultured Streptomyces sp.]
MTSPSSRRLLLAALTVLALASCGTTPSESVPAAGPGSGSPASPPPSGAELEARAAALQTRTEHVYVTRLDGFTLARQSVGVRGDDGFGSVYTGQGGRMLELDVERGELPGPACAGATAPAADDDGAVTCERDGDAWYTATAAGHSYARADGDLVVRVGGARTDLDRATLSDALAATHRADDAELADVLPPVGEASGQQPVERGDLPPVGDGAPLNGAGTTG